MLEYIILAILILLFIFPLNVLACSQFSSVNIQYKKTLIILFAIQQGTVCTSAIKSQVLKNTVQNSGGYNTTLQCSNTYVLYYYH